MKKINPTLLGILKSFGILAFLIAFAYLLSACDYIENNYYECTINQQVDTTTITPNNAGSAIDTNGDLGYTYQYRTQQKIAGYTYDMYMGFAVPSAGTEAGYYKTIIKNGGVDFLTNVITLAESNSTREEDSIIELRDRGLMYSEDLNSKAGGKYVRVGFQGQAINAKAFSYNFNHTSKRADESKVITGLACVMLQDGETVPPSTITDVYGVKWILAPAYEGVYDNLNASAGGDDLYLYYTKDYTGIEITLVNPYYSENYSRLYDNSVMTASLGGITTWRGSDSNSWRPTTDALLTGLTSKLSLDDNYDSDAKSIMRNVEFVRLYDTNMDPIQGDEQYRAANLNRNAGGNKIFLSYSYIEENSPYWINQ